MPLTWMKTAWLSRELFFPPSHTRWLWQIIVFPSGCTLCCNITKIKVTFLGTGGVLQTWKSLHRGLKIHKSVCSFTELFKRSLCQYVLELQGFFVAILQEASDDAEPRNALIDTTGDTSEKPWLCRLLQNPASEVWGIIYNKSLEKKHTKHRTNSLRNIHHLWEGTFLEWLCRITA